MRILLVSANPKNPNAGASRVYHLLATGLAARGHIVTSLHYEDLDISPQLSRIIGRFVLPQVTSRRAAKELRTGYDVICSSDGTLYPLYRELRKQDPRPLLVNHSHGLNFFNYEAAVAETCRGHLSTSWMFKHLTGPVPVRWERLGSESADLSIVQNLRDLDFLIDQEIGTAVSIPLAVHPEIMAAGMSALPAHDRDRDTLVWFGSWTERKGCYYLSKAFGQIVERFPATRLVVGGTGMDQEALKLKFKRKLWPNLTFLPRTSTPTEQIAEFSHRSIFLFPSLSEGFGFVPLEAMAMGLAVVTTYTGFGGDWLVDRENAMVIPPASAIHLARAVVTLMEDNELRCRIAKKGQELARLFTVDRMIDSYELCFQKSIKRLASFRDRE